MSVIVYVGIDVINIYNNIIKSWWLVYNINRFDDL